MGMMGLEWLGSVSIRFIDHHKVQPCWQVLTGREALCADAQFAHVPLMAQKKMTLKKSSTIIMKNYLSIYLINLFILIHSKLLTTSWLKS